MIRKFLTLDGEVLEESEYHLKPTDTCFYCGDTLITADTICPDSQDFHHDWITLCNPKTMGVKGY